MNQNLNEPMTYKQAIEELEQIVREIEEGDLDLDELIKKVERATTLIHFCKTKLKNSETRLEEVIKKLDAASE